MDTGVIAALAESMLKGRREYLDTPSWETKTMDTRPTSDMINDAIRFLGGEVLPLHRRIFAAATVLWAQKTLN